VKASRAVRVPGILYFSCHIFEVSLAKLPKESFGFF
jgi:hypothetical protein